jgi:hypothetical protein
MVDSDGNDQIDAQAHVTGTLLHKTDTAITLLVTSKVGTATVSSWFVSYRGQRITHDPVTGRCLGTLIEQGKTNLHLRSDNLSVSPWSRTGTNVTTNATVSPDGSSNANLLIEDTSTGAHNIGSLVSGLTVGTAYVYSVYVKASGRTLINLGGWGGLNSEFNLSNGTISIAGNGSPQIQNAGNGWYRCSITGNATATNGTPLVAIRQTTNTNSYTGNGTSGIILWGAQFEAGLNATSYIPTTAVAAARAQDLHTITGANFSYMYNQSSGTVFCSYAVSSYASGNGIYGIQAPNRPDAGISAVMGLPTSLTLSVYSSPPNYTNQALFNSTVSTSIQIKTALAARTDNFAGSTNGSISTDNSGTLNPIMDRFVIGATGNTSGPQTGNNIFSAILYYRDRLPNAELQTLTSTVSETIVFNGVPIWYNGEGLIETT